MRWTFVYVTDERGLELAKHSAVSVALSQHDPCDVHIFCYHFSPGPSPEFSAVMARLGVKLIFDTISDTAVEQHETKGHVTTPALLKLSAVGKLVDRYDRIVYLDNDILVFNDLNIEAIDFGRAPIAAVIDMDLSDTGSLRHSIWAHAGGKTDGLGGYFNNGVMIFESRNWRRGEFQEKYAAALEEHDIACPYKLNCTSNDQCAVNRVFEKNWIKLPLAYNMQASAKFTRSWQTASIRHYCGPRKFVPVAIFRNDSRDVRYLNEIRQALDRPTTRFPFLYELSFRLNIVRKYSSDLPIRRFLRAGFP